MPAPIGTSASPDTDTGHECAYDADSRVSAASLTGTVAWLQGITLVWMALECAASLYAAAHAHSVALLAFGSDSLIELLSAVVVLLQFLPRFPLKKPHADRGAAILLFALATAVVCAAALWYRNRAQPSLMGIAIAAVALVMMPGLAWLKRRSARDLNNRALAADATQSATCAYLAAITLAGLATNALWHISWIDSVAALAVVPILIVEGWRAWHGRECGCAS